jgi:hypothetical protein
MTDFLVMHRAGTDDSEWRPVGTFSDRKAAEVENVLEEAANAGAGQYLAVPLGYCTLRDASSSIVLTDPAESE